MNEVPLILIAGAAALLYLGIVELALITGIGAVVTMKTMSNGTTKSSSKSSSSNVKVQPIKIKRKWDEDIKSIYPEKMTIDMDPPDKGLPSGLGIYLGMNSGMKKFGKALGSVTKKARGGSNED